MLGGFVVVLAMLTLVAFGYGTAHAQTNCVRFSPAIVGSLPLVIASC